MHAAVVELNSLADPVRSAAQNHDLALGAVSTLVLVAVGGVVIWRISFELGRACIDQPVCGQGG